MSLDENKILYDLNCNSAKKMWDNLEMIYGVSSSIEQECLNTRGK